MPDLLKPLAPSSFSLDIDGLGELVFKSCEVAPNKPKLAGEADAIGSGPNGRSVRQVNSAGFEEVTTIKAVSICSPSSGSASKIMWAWFKACLPPSDGGDGNWAGSKKTGSIKAFDTDDQQVAQWDFKEAWPSEYSLAECAVQDNKYLEETWTIVVEHCTRIM
jgi:hypothetical protein